MSHGYGPADGEVLDAPVGTIVFVQDPNLTRAGVAASPGAKDDGDLEPLRADSRFIELVGSS